MRARGAGSLAGLAVLAGLAGACAQKAAGPAPGAAPGAAAPAAHDAMEADGTFTIVTGCGFRVLVNDGEAHFAIDLDGTVTLSEQEGNTGYLAMDDLLVQVVHVSRAQLGALANLRDGRDLLRAHEEWESAYLAGELHAKVEPHEIALELRNVTPKLDAILWWFPYGDHRYWAYATVEVGDHVVGLSARAEHGLEPVDLMGRLARWMATLAPSAAPVSPRAVSAAVRASMETAERCPEPDGAMGVDRRLRLDEIPRGDRDAVGRTAAQLGGVERQVIGDRLRYRNHACRFEVTYPAGGWKDFLVRDLSDTGCMVNVATPLVYDPDAKQKITNAVVLTVARPAADYGAAELQAEIVAAVVKQGAALEPAKRPLLEGATDVTYAVDAEGTRFVGEIATVRRGDLLYNVHFNATRGSVAEGRKHLARWLAGLRLDVP